MTGGVQPADLFETFDLDFCDPVFPLQMHRPVQGEPERTQPGLLLRRAEGIGEIVTKSAHKDFLSECRAMERFNPR